MFQMMKRKRTRYFRWKVWKTSQKLKEKVGNPAPLIKKMESIQKAKVMEKAKNM